MAKKKRKTTKRSTRAPARAGRARSVPDFVDVTDEPADVVIGRVKLLCDNDTEVVFSRAKVRLIMRLQDRK